MGQSRLQRRTIAANAVGAVFVWCLCMAAPAAAKSDLALWRLDCGTMDIEEMSYFSDAFAYDGQSVFLSNGCYLVRNGDRYFLWEAGLPASYLGNETRNNGWLSSLSVTLEDQLAQIDLEPADITLFGISHYHGDHIGQAPAFTNATLFISEADANWIRKSPPGNARSKLAHWFDGDGPITEFSRDHDVFGDGTVRILRTPGHTPGHSSLLVRLPETGDVLLSGDLYHLRREVGLRNVSQWNPSRADTLASIERFEAIVEELDPITIIQHDPVDIDKLPAFPTPAR